MSLDDLFALNLVHSMFGSTRKKKKQQKPKKSYNNWFEKCSADELKALCRASKLPVSGTKAALCERLCHGELSSPYAYEYAPEKFSRARFEYEFGSIGGYGSGGESCAAGGAAPPRPAQQGSKRSSAYSNEDLKTMCREKGLIVSGKRYELVLRLLQAASRVGGAPKRAAGDTDENGTFRPKKRAKSMKLPNVEKIKERAFKKFFPPDEVTFKWSNNKHKYHGRDCVKFACGIIDKEIFEKELFQRGEEKVAWEVINALLYRLTVGNKERRDAYYAKQRENNSRFILMLGGTHVEFNRCDWEMRHELLPKLVKVIKATSSKAMVEELSGDSLWGFHGQLGQYFNGESLKSFTGVLDEYIPRKESEEG